MSLLPWVLIGLGVWLVLAVVGALTLAYLVRANRPDTLDVLRARGLANDEPPPAPDDPRTPDTELPAPRDAEHDRTAAPSERRRD